MKYFITKLSLILILSISFTSALYDSKSDVIKLTSNNFQKDVVNSNDLWLVEFYGKHIYFLIIK
jgi:hypothetical protein